MKSDNDKLGMKDVELGFKITPEMKRSGCPNAECACDGYKSVKMPKYEPAIDNTEGTRSKAQIPAFVKRFQNFQPDKR